MKIAPLLATLFFIGMVLFAYLYFQERTTGSKQASAPVRERLVTARGKMDRIRAADTIQKGDTSVMQLEALQSNDVILSSTFGDIKMAKAYIKNYSAMASDLLGDLDDAGLPPLTQELWMDSASVCSLGRLITQYQYDGLRLYLAAYGSQRTDKDPKRADKGDYDYRITVIAVTTKSDSDVSHKNNHIDVYTDPKTNAISGLFNYHDICPPTCPSSAGDILAQP